MLLFRPDCAALCISLLASCGVCSGAFGHASTGHCLPGIFTLQSNLLPFKQVVIIKCLFNIQVEYHSGKDQIKLKVLKFSGIQIVQDVHYGMIVPKLILLDTFLFFL